MNSLLLFWIFIGTLVGNVSAEIPLDPVPAPIPEINQIQPLMDKKKWPEAIERLKAWQLTASDPFEPGMLLAKAWLLSGERQKSLEQLHKLLALVPNKKKTLVEEQIKITSRMFMTNKAYQTYRDGVDLLISGRSRLAQDRFRSALDQEKENELVLFRLGQSLILEGDYDQGRKFLEEARRLNPLDYSVKAWMGRAAFLSGRLVQAQQELEEGLKQAPALEELVCWSAETWSVLGKKAKAVEFLRAHTDRHPLDLMALATLVRLEFAEVPEKTSVQRWMEIRKLVQLTMSRMDSTEQVETNRYLGEEGIGFKKADELKKELVTLLERIDGKVEESKTQN